MSMHTRCPYCDHKIEITRLDWRSKPDLSPLGNHIDSAHPERSTYTITDKGYRTRTIPYCPIVIPSLADRGNR